MIFFTYRTTIVVRFVHALLLMIGFVPVRKRILWRWGLSLGALKSWSTCKAGRVVWKRFVHVVEAASYYHVQTVVVHVPHVGTRTCRISLRIGLELSET